MRHPIGLRPFAALALALAACHGADKKQHQALADDLRMPITALCGAAHADGGGCQGDCVTWMRASEARAALDAAEALAGVAPFPDPETEALLESVRRAAGEVRSTIGDACPKGMRRTPELGPEVARCAERRQGAAAQIAMLENTVARLRTETASRAGVTMASCR